jgi:hypothetical protein
MQTRKEKWLVKYDQQRHYLAFILPMEEVYAMTKETSYSPSLETIGDWMIRERTTKTIERRVFSPTAFCWATGKSLFLKKSVIVVSEIGVHAGNGLGPPVVEKFCFSPKHYTAWVLKHG